MAWPWGGYLLGEEKMMAIDVFTMTYQDLLTVAGAAALCIMLTQWVKAYLHDWRWTNLLALGLTIALVLAAAAVDGSVNIEEAFAALLTALIGASLATFGYEAILNLLGLAGIGPRKDYIRHKISRKIW